MTVKLTLTEEETKLAQEWLKAKDSEDQWKTYRQSLADSLMQTLMPRLEEVAQSIAEDKLTTEVQLGTLLKTKVGFALSANQTLVMELLRKHPHLINTVFRQKFDPIAPAVLSLVNSGDSLAQELGTAVTQDEIKPYLSKL